MWRRFTRSYEGSFLPACWQAGPPASVIDFEVVSVAAAFRPAALSLCIVIPKCAPFEDRSEGPAVSFFSAFDDSLFIFVGRGFTRDMMA